MQSGFRPLKPPSEADRKARRLRYSVILTMRVLNARALYDAAPTHENKNWLNHTFADLRRRRPVLYADLIERSRPKACQACARAVSARLRAGMWVWSCGYCGSGGFAKLDLSAAIAAMQQEATSASK